MAAEPVAPPREGFDHAAGLGLALPGDVEGRAVGDAGAHDRQPSVTFTARCMASSLIAMCPGRGTWPPRRRIRHRGPGQSACRRAGARQRRCPRPCAVRRRADDRAFFVAKQPFFAGVRVQSADANARRRAAFSRRIRVSARRIFGSTACRLSAANTSRSAMCNVTWTMPSPAGPATCSSGAR